MVCPMCVFRSQVFSEFSENLKCYTEFCGELDIISSKERKKKDQRAGYAPSLPYGCHTVPPLSVP